MPPKKDLSKKSDVKTRKTASTEDDDVKELCAMCQDVDPNKSDWITCDVCDSLYHVQCCDSLNMDMMEKWRAFKKVMAGTTGEGGFECVWKCAACRSKKTLRQIVENHNGVLNDLQQKLDRLNAHIDKSNFPVIKQNEEVASPVGQQCNSVCEREESAHGITFSEVVRKRNKKRAPGKPIDTHTVIPGSSTASPPTGALTPAAGEPHAPRKDKRPTLPVKRTLQPEKRGGTKGVPLQAARKMAHTYVGRAGPQVTEQQILDYLESNGASGEATVQLLYSGTESRSFKISTEEKDGPTILADNFWPTGFVVRPFRATKPLRQKREDPDQGLSLERRGSQNGPGSPTAERV